MKTFKVEKTVEVEITIEDLTDEELLEECGERGILPDKGIDKFSDAEVLSEYKDRFRESESGITVEAIYEEFRRRGDAPECLRNYIYDSIGRIL